MDALSERKYFESWGRSFKVTLWLSQFKLINRGVIFLISTFIRIIRWIYTNPKNNSKILTIINLHRLGDTVFTIPAMKAIAEHYTNYRMIVVCYVETSPILKLLFKDREYIELNKVDFVLGRRIARKTIRRRVLQLNSEIIFDLTGMPNSASLIYKSNAHTIVGMNLEYFSKIYTHFTAIRQKPHYMDMYLDVAKLIVPDNDLDKMKYFPSSSIEEIRILIHPFAIRRPKEWDLNKYVEIAKELKNEYSVKIVSPKGFIKSDIIDEINKLEIEFCETNTIEDLIFKIENCTVFISNDSGPVYIASLLGKATFTIYGPTNPKYSLPYGKHHRFVQYKLNCTPKEERVCFTYAGIFCPSYECMENLSVEFVNKEIITFIDSLLIKET